MLQNAPNTDVNSPSLFKLKLAQGAGSCYLALSISSGYFSAAPPPPLISTQAIEVSSNIFLRTEYVILSLNVEGKSEYTVDSQPPGWQVNKSSQRTERRNDLL